MGMARTWLLRALAAGAATALVLPLAAGPAAAAGGGTGGATSGTGAGTGGATGGNGYGRWGVNGTLSLPAASFVTTSTNPSTPTSAVLGAQTPFGAVYGSSKGQSYLLLQTAAGRAPSNTVLTFAAPTVAGSWGFALGDVDADQVTVSATGADGRAVTAEELGWQGAFNYCAAPASGCVGTDLPLWDPATATLTGNGPDTNGASGWFRPTVPVRSLTLRFTAQSGSPVYQLWTAGRTAAVSGRLTTTGCGLPDPTVLHLRHPDGTDTGLTSTAAPDGSYSFSPVTPGRYQVALDEYAGYTPDVRTLDADVSERNVEQVDFRLQCPREEVLPSSSPTPSPSPTSASRSATPTPSSATRPELADTGAVDLGALLAGGATLTAAGGTLLLTTRRRRARS